MVGWCATDPLTWACSTRRSSGCANRNAALVRGRRKRAPDEESVLLFHLGITLPRAPTRLLRRVIHHRALTLKSVTHVLGLKCHPCPQPFRPRSIRAWIPIPTSLA